MAKRQNRRKAKVNKSIPVAATVVEVPYVYVPDSFERTIITLGTFFDNAIKAIIQLLTKKVA